MANKKYTLYFKGINKYGHEHSLPIVSLYLKELDTYTSNYNDYKELFDNLPTQVTNFIKEELSYGIDNDFENSFYITDNDYTPIMDVIFKKDSDVLFIEPKELELLLKNNVMTCEEFQKSMLKTLSNDDLIRRYEFYKYLYYTYVKNEKIKSMIDLYYVNKKESDIDDDIKYIEAIATDKVNLIILAKKLSGTLESRRNLAYEFKKSLNNNSILDKDIISYRRNESKETVKPLSSIIVNFSKFKKEYDKEYQ